MPVWKKNYTATVFANLEEVFCHILLTHVDTKQSKAVTHHCSLESLLHCH